MVNDYDYDNDYDNDYDYDYDNDYDNDYDYDYDNDYEAWEERKQGHVILPRASPGWTGATVCGKGIRDRSFRSGSFCSGKKKKGQVFFWRCSYWLDSSKGWRRSASTPRPVAPIVWTL